MIKYLINIGRIIFHISDGPYSKPSLYKEKPMLFSSLNPIPVVKFENVIELKSIGPFIWAGIGT